MRAQSASLPLPPNNGRLIGQKMRGKEPKGKRETAGGGRLDALEWREVIG